jgi:tetratricopeptide (TPR) repeat protein
LIAQGRSADPPWFQEITADAPSFHEAVGVLHDYGLAESSVKQTPGLHGYSLHRYVHSWAVHVLNDTKSKISAKPAMRCVSQHVAGDIEAAREEGGRRLLPHAERCWGMFVDGLLADENDPSIFFYVGFLLGEDLSKIDKPIAMYEQACKLYEAWERENRPQHNIGFSYTNLAWRYQVQCRYDEAVASYLRGIPLIERQYGPEHIETGKNVRFLGWCYECSGKYEEAIRAYLRALPGYEEFYGKDHEETHGVITDLADAYEKGARFEDARSMLERLRQGYENAKGPSHQMTLGVLKRLGKVYDALGMHEEKVAVLKRVAEQEQVEDGAGGEETCESRNT